jgi:hypothetical protein
MGTMHLLYMLGRVGDVITCGGDEQGRLAFAA